MTILKKRPHGRPQRLDQDKISDPIVNQCSCRQWQKVVTLFLKHKCDLSGEELRSFEWIEYKLAHGEQLTAKESLKLALMAALSSGWDTVEDIDLISELN
jgi:hypothetical protein